MKMKVILSFAMAATTLFAMTCTAYAADIPAEANVIEEQQQTEFRPMFKRADGSFNLNRENLQEKLAALLAEGKITQERYAAIISGEMKPMFNGEKKFAELPEGFEKPEMGGLMTKGFGRFKKPDGSFEMNKEVMQEKLAAQLAEGKITQEQYDAIISGETKPMFNGEKKFAALPEGFEKTEMGGLMAKGFGKKFKKPDGSFEMNK